MPRKVGLVKWAVIIAAVSLFPLGSSVYAATKTATVALIQNDVAGSGTVGSVTVTSSTGPSGGSTLTLTVDNTIDGHIYILYLGRDGRTFRILNNIYVFTGTGAAVTVEGVQMTKAPTNGQSFQLADLTSGVVVATSEPIKY